MRVLDILRPKLGRKVTRDQQKYQNLELTT